MVQFKPVCFFESFPNNLCFWLMNNGSYKLETLLLEKIRRFNITFVANTNFKNEWALNVKRNLYPFICLDMIWQRSSIRSCFLI